MVRIDGGAFERLGKMITPPAPPPPPKKKKREEDEYWEPALEPTQQKVFDCGARYVLAYGEKGSGKTIGLLHKLVRHCYENDNALGLILVRVKSMATKGGAWDKLTQHILPRWKDGLDIEYSDVKFDAQHNEYLWVENQHGGWSMIVLISAPHAHQLRERIRGYEPSFVLVDELTSCDSVEYLRAVGAQVGRREGVDGIQQYTAACNPEGPSHWVYKVWFEEAFDPVTGQWDSDYAKFHVPIQENEKNLPPGYIQNLVKLYRSDPVEAARMLRGEWIDRPSGEAIFKDIFVPAIHIKPEPGSAARILPDPDHPVIIGMDPGSANNAFIFMQWMPVEDLLRWVVFDELVYTRRRLLYSILVPAFLRRMKFWNERMGVKFRTVYNSDNSAFNQFRAAGGSYDVLEFEKIANATAAGAEPLWKRYGLAGPMKVTPAPKFAGSKAARVRLIQELLSTERLLVSSGCTKVIEMFAKLDSEAGEPGMPQYDSELALTPKKGSVHGHPFDALSYPPLTASLTPHLLVPPAAEQTQTMIPIGS
ncbi:MAG: phage terminase large subunit [Opitutaceae bacterium]|nr:phage terminase large subunit [Opitutaceae bacterium]